MFYENFLKLCKERNISVYKAVNDMGIGQSTATRWKQGTATPKADTLQKIADYFGVTTDYLLTGENTPSASKTTDNPGITFDDFTYAMYDHSKDLTDEEKKMLLEMAEFMKKKRGL